MRPVEGDLVAHLSLLYGRERRLVQLVAEDAEEGDRGARLKGV